MSPLTRIQKGLLGEHEFWEQVVLGTGGDLEPRRPEPDDERVDFVVHPPGVYEPVFAFQVKTAERYERREGKARKQRRLRIDLIVKRHRLITSPHFFYVLAHYDAALTSEHQWGRFTDPIFVAPSEVVHAMARPARNETVLISITASMEPNSRDRWLPYRVHPWELGATLQQLLASPPPLTMTQRRQWRAFLRETLGPSFGRLMASG